MARAINPTPRSDFSLDARQRADARAALALLTGSGLTLTTAAELALQRRGTVARQTLGVVADRFLLSRVRKTGRGGKALRAATLDSYEAMLRPIVRDWAQQPFCDITRTQLRDWLQQLQTGPSMRRALARACKTLWRWALTEEPPLATADISIGLDMAVSVQSEEDRRVLTVAQAHAILTHGAEWARPALALMLFAAIRPEEIAGRGKPPLDWSAINVREKFIRLPPEITKRGRSRLLEHMPDALWTWLPASDQVPKGPIARFKFHSVRIAARVAAGFCDAQRTILRPWPHDCLRHTAATYLLAYTRDAGKVSMWLGHEGNPALLHNTYRGVLTVDHTHVTHAEAVRYFAIRPGAPVPH